MMKKVKLRIIRKLVENPALQGGDENGMKAFTP
jgi:hypothetical protein